MWRGRVQVGSLETQVEATRQLITINTDMLKVVQYQFTRGYASKLDVAAQQSQLAQTVAALPPLLKQLAQQRDLLAVLAGRFPSQAPSDKFILASLQLPLDLPLSLPRRWWRTPRCAAGRGQHACASAQSGSYCQPAPNIWAMRQHRAGHW